MDENPYKAPEDPRRRETFKEPLDKWTSIGLIVLGIAALGYGVYLVWSRGILAVAPFGGGAAMLMLGLLKYNLSPRKSNQKFS